MNDSQPVPCHQHEPQLKSSSKSAHKKASVEGGWWLYMITTASGKLYTGITTDVDRRFAEHVSDKVKGAKFFRSDAAKAVVYREACDDRSQASKREAVIKKMRRAEKLQLIKTHQTL